LCRQWFTKIGGLGFPRWGFVTRAPVVGEPYLRVETVMRRYLLSPSRVTADFLAEGAHPGKRVALGSPRPHFPSFEPLPVSAGLCASRPLEDLDHRGALLESVQELDDEVLVLLRELRSCGGANVGVAGAVGVPSNDREEVAVSRRKWEVLRAFLTILGRFP
jgi:hypothetical protein